MSIEAVAERKAERIRRKRYSEEFQREAVRLLEAGCPAAQLSRELGVSVWNIGQWRARHGTPRLHHFGSEGLTPKEQANQDPD